MLFVLCCRLYISIEIHNKGKQNAKGGQAKEKKIVEKMNTQAPFSAFYFRCAVAALHIVHCRYVNRLIKVREIEAEEEKESLEEDTSLFCF